MNKTTLNSQEEKYSMLSLRRATFVGLAAHRLRNISIHALLAESDLFFGRDAAESRYFYPRSPCGERLCVCRAGCPAVICISIHALLAESDSGLCIKSRGFQGFLSTLSLRRATVSGLAQCALRDISIHALLAESDPLFLPSLQRL